MATDIKTRIDRMMFRKTLVDKLNKGISTPSLGTIPRYNPESDKDVDIRGVGGAIIPGINYVKNQPSEFVGWQPVYYGSPSRKNLEERPKAVLEILKNWKKSAHSGGTPAPITVDRGHAASDTGEDQKSIGYIVDLMVVDETNEGVIVTFDKDNKEYPHKLEAGSVWLLAKVAWLPDGIKDLKQGIIPYPSIMFTGKPYVIRNLGAVLVPAMESVPALPTFVSKQLDGKNLIMKGLNKQMDVIKKMSDGKATEMIGALQATGAAEDVVDRIATALMPLEDGDIDFVLKIGKVEEPAEEPAPAETPEAPLVMSQELLTSIVAKTVSETMNSLKKSEVVKTNPAEVVVVEALSKGGIAPDTAKGFAKSLCSGCETTEQAMSNTTTFLKMRGNFTKPSGKLGSDSQVDNVDNDLDSLLSNPIGGGE